MFNRRSFWPLDRSGRRFLWWILLASALGVRAQTNRPTLQHVGSWQESLGRPVHAVVVRDSYAWLANGEAGLTVLDVSNPSRPVQVGRYAAGGPVVALELVGNLALLAELTNGLELVNLDDPVHPWRVSGLPNLGNVQDVVVSGSNAFAAGSLSGIRVVDISNPLQPVLIGGLPNSAIMGNPGTGKLQVFGRYAFLASGSAGVTVIDVTNPAHPVVANVIETPGEVRDVQVMDTWAFVADGSDGLRIINVGLPGPSAAIGGIDTPGQANDVFVMDGCAFVADGPAGIQMIDISNPQKPVWIGGAETAGDALQVWVTGKHVFVADGPKGLAIFILSEPVIGSLPKILTPPHSQSVPIGSRTVFSVGTAGTPPLRYQWFKNGLALPRAEYPWLAMMSTSPSDQGKYVVAISNALGSVVTAPVSLWVEGLGPVIIDEPKGQTLATGDTFTLGARVSGWEPIFYQWFFNGLPLPRANDFKWVVTKAQIAQSGPYYLLASNAFGAVTSTVAQIRVIEPLQITQAVISTNVILGRENVLTIETTGAKALQIQWRLNGVNIPGATNDSLTLPSIRVRDGGRYSVVVVTEAGVVGRQVAELKIAVAEMPVADMFADRRMIRELDNIVRSSNVGATREQGEPRHAGKPGGKSIWFSWKAPSNGQATFSTEGSDFDTLLAVYTGEQVDQLSLEAANEDSGGYLTSKVQCYVEAGQIYQIAVDGFAGAEGTVLLSWNFEPLLFAAPQIIQEPQDQLVPIGGDAKFWVITKGTGLEYQWSFSGIPLLGATNALLVLTHVQPQQAGEYRVRVNRRDRMIDSVSAQLEVYEITAGDPGILETGQDKLEDLMLKAEVLTPTASKLGVLRRIGLMYSAPSSGYTVTRWGSTSGNTTQTYETGTCGQIGGASQWFRLALSKPGLCTLSTEGSNFDTLLAVYKDTGDWMDPLSQPVDCDDNSGADGLTSRLQFSAQSASNYFVLVDGVNGASGTVQLTTTLEPWTEMAHVGTDTNGNFGFQFEVPKGWVFRIDGSTNLQEWLPLLSTNAPQGLLEFIDEDWDAYGERFYRVVPVP
jgi:hypothetical protein